MASKVLLKKSSVAGKAPLTSDLSYGELAINYKDGVLYYRTDIDNVDQLVAPDLIYNKITGSLSTVIATAVDSWDSTKYRTAKYIIQISQGSNYQSSEMLVVHNGSTTFNTEYAILQTDGVLATVSTDMNGGNVRLLITMMTNGAATINIKRTLSTV